MMDLFRVSEMVLRAVMKGDEESLKMYLGYANHMQEIAPPIAESVNSGEEFEQAMMTHSIRCSQCFTFALASECLMPIEDFWKHSEEHKHMEHPWLDNWSSFRN